MENLCREVDRQAGPEIRARLTCTEKNNGLKLDVLCLEEEGIGAVPAIYMEAFYESYQRGAKIPELAERILEEYREIRGNAMAFSPKCFLDFEQASSHIYCRLIHREKNQELLERIPYTPWLDLAETYYFELSDQELPDGTILISLEHLELWNITPLELKCLAWENMLRDKKPYFKNLAEILAGLVDLCDDPPVEDRPLLHMLSLETESGGAIAVRYPGILDTICEKLDCWKLYLIPSSIHEFLVLPAACGVAAEEVNQMIQSVNAEQVLPSDVLSDHVYCYDRGTGLVTLPEAV